MLHELVDDDPELKEFDNKRSKAAKKERQRQLQRWKEWLRQERLGSTIARRRSPPKVDFEQCSQLAEIVARNDIIRVQKLLQEGMNPNSSNVDGLTPLHKCCIDNTVEMAEILLEYGADMNARDVEGWTPLHAASATGAVAMINLLLEEGANLIAINHDDNMPVDVACDGDIKYILQQRMLGAGYTDDVLEYIRVSVPKTMLADLKDSVKNGRSLNVKDKYGSTAFHVAAANGYSEVLEYLLSQSDIDLNIQDNEGWTPFHAAVCWGQKETMKMLAEKGAVLDMKNIHGETPYAIADDPNIQVYILELKGEFSEDKVVEDREKRTIKPRRASVKHAPDKASTSMAQRDARLEAMLREASMAEGVGDETGGEEEGVGDETGGEAEGATVPLLAATAMSDDAEAPKREIPRLPAESGELKSKYEEFEPKGILKPGPVMTFATPYPSSGSPPGSPTGSGQKNWSCCMIV